MSRKILKKFKKSYKLNLFQIIEAVPKLQFWNRNLRCNRKIGANMVIILTILVFSPVFRKPVLKPTGVWNRLDIE
jgi:hypothetical protein